MAEKLESAAPQPVFHEDFLASLGDGEEEELPEHTYTALGMGPWQVLPRREDEGTVWVVLAGGKTVIGRFSYRAHAHLYAAAAVVATARGSFTCLDDPCDYPPLPVVLFHNDHVAGHLPTFDPERLSALNALLVLYEHPDALAELLAGAGAPVLRRVGGLLEAKRGGAKDL